MAPLTKATVELWRSQVQALRDNGHERWGRKGYELWPPITIDVESIEAVIAYWDAHHSASTPLTRGEVARKLDVMGITLVNYRDPVDGSNVPCLDIEQVLWLINHFEAALREAVETRPIRVDVHTPEATRNLVQIAVLEERKRILGMLGEIPASGNWDNDAVLNVIRRI